MTTKRELEALAASWEERGDLLMTASECAEELRRALAEPTQCVTVTDGFDVFWEAYPRKDAKRDAQKAWKQVGVTAEQAHAMALEVSERARKDPQWLKGRRFIPLPATFIRGERWNDEWRQDIQAERPAHGGRPADRVRSDRELAAQRALDALRGAQQGGAG